MILVHCVTTGLTYRYASLTKIFSLNSLRFPCGRWLSRNEDDGSIDRFLVGERVTQKIKGQAAISALS